MLQLHQSGNDVYNHYGVNMVLESIMQYSKPKSDSEYLDVRQYFTERNFYDYIRFDYLIG